MEEKYKTLKELIMNNNLSKQQRLNKIIQTLQRTEDMTRGRYLSDRITAGDFTEVNDKSVDDLILAFGGTIEKKVAKASLEDRMSVLEAQFLILANKNKELEEYLRIETQRNKELKEYYILKK